MSHLRFTLDLAVKQPIPAALQNALPTIRNKVRQLKSYAEKINAGQPNEELSVRATYHVCHHDTGEPCEEEQDV